MKFKNSFNHIFSNNIRKQEFHFLCVWLVLSKLRVPWDVDTRWNSTNRRFHRCFTYKHAITETLLIFKGIHLLISEGEWDQLEMLKSFFGVFFTVTVKLPCSYTPSIYELFHHLSRISKVNYLFFLIWLILIFIFFLSHLFLYSFFYLFFSIFFFLSHLFLYFCSQKVYR
jgi:hypothetical protein